MALQKTKTLLINGCLLMSLVLCGCGGRSLSEREIVRGVLFTRQGPLFSACLVLADQNAQPESDGNKVASAQGKTPAQALERAEQSLYGEVYYGLLDLVALPSDTDLATAREIGELLYNSAQPAPELSVFILSPTTIESWAKQGSALYLDMKNLEQTYKVHCGLQQLFSQENVCAIPGYRTGGGYDFLLLPESAPSVRCSGLSQAQLAAVLCGQTSVLNGTFAGGEASCSARTQVIVDGNRIQLHLRDVTLTALSPSVASSLQPRLQQELQASFEHLWRCMEQAGADPFHFQFWQACLYGTGSEFSPPVLEVLFD